MPLAGGTHLSERHFARAAAAGGRQPAGGLHLRRQQLREDLVAVGARGGQRVSQLQQRGRGGRPLSGTGGVAARVAVVSRDERGGVGVGGDVGVEGLFVLRLLLLLAHRGPRPVARVGVAVAGLGERGGDARWRRGRERGRGGEIRAWKRGRNGGRGRDGPAREGDGAGDAEERHAAEAWAAKRCCCCCWCADVTWG